MSIIDIPLKQHKKIVVHATELANMIRAGKLPDNTSKAARTVKRLLLEIVSHLNVEDQKIYPMMQNHEDSHVRSIGAHFQDEMGKMAPAVVAWGEKWAAQGTISDDPDGFINETRGLFKVLKNRIDREETELYPLLG